ncbi:PepSY domain-containing protein [Pseudooctadecabacter jejudonensis]|uniref:Peptidase propeptide and YPEB domain protein n=1 Tax=Pseudooctadecabacter jejudonensis TaxID=1391910 RepID=A0A1Y5SIA4_9RHOB|nr:PepSY domain-containing protein [Pseudooctadecabacter jejudonensis]SLN38465.1 Peptidase propeptide and YPEB domain protein [Pseudooctadecabacter jejudonensis]
MNINTLKIGALSGLIAVGGIATMVSAQTTAEQTNLTVEQVIEIALIEVPGEITEVELEERRGSTFYEVEITAEDGSEMELKIAADDGEILRVKEDDRGCDDDHDDDDEDEGEDA